MEPEPTVSYTVREALDSIDRRLETVVNTFLSQIDKQNDRIDGAYTKINDLEKAQEARKAVGAHWSSMLAAAGAVGAAVAAIATALIAIHG